jgi:hypothetical protein
MHLLDRLWIGQDQAIVAAVILLAAEMLSGQMQFL